MMHHAQIAQRAFNTPLMADPAKALAFLSGLGPRITGQDITFPGVETSSVDPLATAPPARASLFGTDLTQRYQRNGSQPFTLVDGIAVIEIAGTLVHRGAWIGQSSGLTSYEGIAAQIGAALSDPAVRGIALDIDSFGGEVAGAFDLADRIRAARAQKPVQAFVAEHALSAGYALASQADRIILPRTGAVGSIGVVALHTDMSGALDQKGIAVTLIHAGAHKIDANPYQPLPEAVHDQMQRELEIVRFLFAETVAAGRGDRLSDTAALATEAAVFRGADAIAAGLADELADPITAFRAFVDSPHATNSTSRKGPQMTTNPTDTADTDQTTDIARPTTEATPDPHEPSGADTAAETVASAPAAPSPEASGMTAEAIRAEAAEVAQVCAQAARLGLDIDAADAVARGLKPDALRSRVLADLAARSDAAGIIATAPAAAATKDSPIIAAAKKAATASR
jgi:signal peptide peptidase SppA